MVTILSVKCQQYAGANTSSSKKAKHKKGHQGTPDRIFGSSKKPIGFLPSGCLNDSEPSEIVVMRPAFGIQQAASPQYLADDKLKTQLQDSIPFLNTEQITFQPLLEENSHQGLGFNSEASEASVPRCLTVDEAVSSLGTEHLESDAIAGEDLEMREMPTFSSGLGHAHSSMPQMPDEGQTDAEAILDIRPNLILNSGAFNTEFGCLSVVEDRQQGLANNELEGTFFIHCQTLDLSTNQQNLPLPAKHLISSILQLFYQ